MTMWNVQTVTVRELSACSLRLQPPNAVHRVQAASPEHDNSPAGRPHWKGEKLD